MSISNRVDYRKLERIVKGFANHRRLQILDLLNKEPELTLEQISEKVGAGYMNTSDHIRRMTLAGLVLKKHDGLFIHHRLTKSAEAILAFCKKLY